MSNKLEEILDKIVASKEVLSTMPKNNLKNINIYQEKLEELEEEYKNYQKDIFNKLKKIYQNETQKTNNKEIENLKTRLKTISYILELLDEERSPYEKMGLDRSIFTISRYYKENFEKINKQIQLCIEKFLNVGIQISLNDFNYSIYVKDYMKTFFQELEKGDVNSKNLKEKFEEIYWKCPDIIVYIELNIRNIYLKKETLIIKYFEKEKNEKLKRLNVTTKEIKKTYSELKKQLIEKITTDPEIIKEKFLSGELVIKNFEKEKIENDIAKILSKEIAINLDENEEVKENINNFLNNLYEYQKYIKFKFIIDDIKKYYQEKDKYKKAYIINKKEIEKLENKLTKLNKKNIKRGLFGKKKVEYRQTQETKELIQKIKDKYRELDMNKFYNKIYSYIDKDSTIFDVLNLANSYYIYLTSCIIKNFKNIQPEEIDKKVQELDDFLNNPFNTIINHTSFIEENDLSLIIKDRYKLLSFNIEKEDLGINNISSLISKLENIQTAINMKKANLRVEDIEVLCEIKKILQLN